MARIHLGTSGYAYRDWRGLLYRKGLAVSKWLPRYAEVFSSVELNNTFYRLPTEQAVERWREQTPPGFSFSCKGSRYLTHLKRLRDVGPGLERFFSRAVRLGEKLAVVLWQLPPQMDRADPARLAAFLDHLPRGPRLRHAVEFRSAAWYTERIARLLDAHGAAFCEHDLVDRTIPYPTGNFRYLRFHGTTGRYHGRYGRQTLTPVARDLSRWQSGGRDAFVYFNNDREGHALYDALELSSLLGQKLGLQPEPEQLIPVE